MPSIFLALAAFFIPIKPAPANLFLVLAMGSVFLFSVNRQQLRNTLLHPVGWGSIGLFLLLLASQLYSSSSWVDASEYTSKYARLAYIPFLAAAVVNQAQVMRVLVGFSAGMLLTLLLTIAIALEPETCTTLGLVGCGPAWNPTVFKLHITQNYFMALAAALWSYGFVQWRKQPGMQTAAWGLLALSVLGFFNVLFMVDGRTGWVVVLVLMAYVFYQRLGWKGALAGGVLATLLLCLAVWFVPALQQMFVNAYQEFQVWLKEGVSDGRSGMRLTYYSHAVNAFVQAPWLGHGLGGVRQAMNLQSAGDPNLALNNPHNQYLLFAVQTGLFGLIAYCAYICLLFKTAGKSKISGLYIPFLITFCTANLFNSFHFDMSEAIVFVTFTGILLAKSVSFTQRQGWSASCGDIFQIH